MCTVNDCQASYRRKDHLTRHLLQHQGKTFKCHIENCNLEFCYQSNLKRHVCDYHDENSTSTCVESQKEYVCPEIGCGKVFRYASQLQKHEDSHGKFPFFRFSVRISKFFMACLQSSPLFRFLKGVRTILNKVFILQLSWSQQMWCAQSPVA